MSSNVRVDRLRRWPTPHPKERSNFANRSGRSRLTCCPEPRNGKATTNGATPPATSPLPRCSRRDRHPHLLRRTPRVHQPHRRQPGAVAVADSCSSCRLAGRARRAAREPCRRTSSVLAAVPRSRSRPTSVARRRVHGAAPLTRRQTASAPSAERLPADFANSPDGGRSVAYAASQPGQSSGKA